MNRLGGWITEDGSTVKWDPEVIEKLAAEVTEGFRRYPWGGVEVGGIFTGRRIDNGVVIEGYQPSVCEHDSGPSFELSPNDKAVLEKQIAAARQDGAEVIGWYHTVSHRELALTEAGRKVFDAYFPERWQMVLVVKRSKSDAPIGDLYWRREKGVHHRVLSPLLDESAIEFDGGAEPECVTPVRVVREEEPTPVPEPEPEPPVREPEPGPVPEPEPDPDPVPPIREPEPEPEPDPVPPIREPEPEPALLPELALTVEPPKSRPGPTLVRPPAPPPRLVADPHPGPPRPMVVPPPSTDEVWPFGLTPDPDFFYRSRQHAEALSMLHYGVVGRKGYVMLTGESGMGKTMVMECLTDKLASDGVEFAYVFNSKLTRQELFELLAIDFELPVADARKTAVLMALNDKLIERAHNGLITALLVDDAQKLSTDVLEEIELLGNLETRKGKLLQVVISGRPEFENMLTAPELRGFRQRFVMRSRLGPLSERETYEYIDFRMSRVDGPWKVLLPERLWPEIYRVTHGVPRIISAVCGRLLESNQASTQASIDEVVAEFGLEN